MERVTMKETELQLRPLGTASPGQASRDREVRFDQDQPSYDRDITEFDELLAKERLSPATPSGTFGRKKKADRVLMSWNIDGCKASVCAMLLFVVVLLSCGAGWLQDFMIDPATVRGPLDKITIRQLYC
jgi:hypothetical protein